MQFKHQLKSLAEHGMLYESISGTIGPEEPTMKEYDTRFIWSHIDGDSDWDEDKFKAYIGTTCYPDFIVTYIIDLKAPPTKPVEIALLGADPYHEVDLSWKVDVGTYTLLWTKGPADSA